MKRSRPASIISVIITVIMLCSFVVTAGAADMRSVSKPEHENYTSSIYNEEDGLPTGEANVVLHTSDGYIWIGSYGGLIRYDGTNFRNYSTERLIGSSSIRSLYEDSKGRLWIGTNDVGVYVMENDKFTHIDCTEEHSFLCIRDFTEDADGNIHVASNSGIATVKDNTLIPCTDKGLANEIVYTIGVDKFGRVWGSMNSGACAVVKDGKLVDILETKGIFEDNDVYCLDSDENGNIFLGSTGTEIAKLELGSEALSTSDFKITKYSTDSVMTHNSINVYGSKVLVNGLQGFCCVDTENNECIAFDEKDYALSVNSSSVDYEGNFWLASSAYGVIKYSVGCFVNETKNSELASMSLNAITKHGGLYYVATDSGLTIWNEDWTRVENSLTEKFTDIRVRAIISDSSNNIWIASYSDFPVVCYNPASGEITDFGADNGLNDTRARVVYELSDGSVAAGTQLGVSIIRNGKVEKTYGPDEGIKNTTILCIVETEDGSILAGSDGDGIYEIKNGEVINHSFDQGLSEGVVLRILKDKDNDAYFISAGSSLYYWKDGSFRKLENFEKHPGSIFDFYDNGGYIWLLQNDGILKINKTQLLGDGKADVLAHGTEHGLSGSLNANTWNYTDEDGKLYLSTRSGVSSFSFETLETALPKSIINLVAVDDKAYEHPDRLTLESGAKSITIDFAVLSYTDISSLKIAYILDGFDREETILEKASESVRYTNLPGGNYTFRLIISDLENPENSVSISLPIEKKLSLFEMPIFWIIVVVLGAAIIALITTLALRAKIKRLRERQREYKCIIEQSLTTFARTIDAKDPYTNGHSTRVAEYSREIARRMGISKEDQEDIYYMALLHDIGKIGIPDKILCKPDKLTDEERRIIQTHPAIGGDILKNFTALPHVEEGARYHHEKYDGTGYCEGKAGEDIPLVARIIGVADSYDAMSSDRCYRKALPQDVIISELNKAMGTQLDPAIVPHMLDMIEDGTAPITKEYESVHINRN